MPEIPVTVTHNGVVITYDERFNKWTFTLRDREREASTLALAKEAIDRPVKEKNVFKRVPAWSNGCYANCTGRFERAEITSISAGGKINVVFNEKNPRKLSQREQTRPEYVFPQNPQNDALIAEHTKLLDEYQALGQKLSEVCKKLQHYVLPGED